MRVFLLLLVSVLVLGCQNAAQREAAKKATQVLNYQKSDADYQSLVNKVKAMQASDEDYDALIKVYPLTSFYSANSELENQTKQRSQAYMQAQNWHDCFDANIRLTQQNYVSLTAHYGAAICATEMSDIKLGGFHKSVLDQLIAAIWRTGDGKSPSSAFYVTSSNDLLAFVQLHQLVVLRQSLEYVDELPIQGVEVQKQDSQQSFIWYFNVTPQFRRGLIDEIERR